MKTRTADLEVINNFVVPCILGSKAFKELLPHQLDVGYNETAVFHSLLSNLKPNCAIEIGTERGSRLAIIAKHSKRVISIDIDPNVKSSLASQFSNAEFITGDSHTVLPDLLQKLASEKAQLDFIFIDGDHTEAGVREDIENVLSYRPVTKMLVLMHDTFNPECRKGIFSAQWSRNPYCHFVDLDFSPGILHPNEEILREMWGGLGLALFLPDARTHELEVKTTHQLMYEAAYLQSVHKPTTEEVPTGFLSRVLRKK